MGSTLQKPPLARAADSGDFLSHFLHANRPTLWVHQVCKCLISKVQKSRLLHSPTSPKSELSAQAVQGLEPKMASSLFSWPAAIPGLVGDAVAPRRNFIEDNA